jgi:hypothetical protein
MTTVKNLSATPLRIPLPGGKTLHLGPGKSASVRDGATDHPALKRLCDSGLLELGNVTAGGLAASDFSLREAVSAHGASSSRR